MVWEEENKNKNDEMYLDRSVFLVPLFMGRRHSQNSSLSGAVLHEVCRPAYLCRIYDHFSLPFVTMLVSLLGQNSKSELL